ncbi:hypothetical protein SAMN02745127_00266 [Oceanospirillum multiglobuliferum]|uniref:Lipoprotein n=1 Tax=Oceanospirillum multiglobuliferum TaxID=64969 RepID=A0A1T4KWM4_9GAMM|nr:hypothetical protein [Oceanospirillum multiglobuliferum]OPX54984.1 hypothetical protein BTE48_11640 [Oceanospirillum multiglobuliferum]SJZ46835.1 hypothetical protein SAMN02745127_00266 [Oceanospirillum multiglobuliferum]
MKRQLLSVALPAALLGACLPAFADNTEVSQGYKLPENTILTVQVLVDRTIAQGETVSHLLLKATGTETEASLPERCLMSADATINNKRLEINVTRALCVQPDGHIYDGAMQANALASDSKLGLTKVCTDGSCSSAELVTGQDYRLKLTADANIALVINYSEQVNIQRRQHQDAAE